MHKQSVRSIRNHLQQLLVVYMMIKEKSDILLMPNIKLKQAMNLRDILLYCEVQNVKQVNLLLAVFHLEQAHRKVPPGPYLKRLIIKLGKLHQEIRDLWHKLLFMKMDIQPE